MVLFCLNVQSIWIIVFLIACHEFAICDGQEKPLFTTPNFSKQTFRQNFCPRQRLVEDGKIELRDALRGMDLRPALFRYELDAKTGAINELNPSISVEVLDAIARRAGFQWRNSFGVVDPPKGNHTWTDVLFWASSTYDLVGEWFLRSEERLALGVLFSEPWMDSSVIMVKKTEKKNFTFFSFLSPFTLGLWGLIGFTLVVSGLVYFLIDYADSQRLEKKMDYKLPESIFNASWMFTGNSILDPKSSATRLLIFSLSFLCLISVAVYTANLASFLVKTGTDKIIIDDINDVIKEDLSCCVDELMPTYNFMKFYHPDVKLVPIKDEEFNTEIYHALQKSECDIMLTYRNSFESRRRDSEFNPNCNLEWVGEVLDDQNGHFPLMGSSEVCSSFVNNVLTFHLLEMKRDKTLYTIMENFALKSTTVFCNRAKEENEGTQSIGVDNMSGIFVVYSALLFASIMWSLFRFYSDPHTRGTVNIPNDVRSSITGRESLKRKASTPITGTSIGKEELSSGKLNTEQFAEENVNLEFHKFRIELSKRDRHLKDSVKKMQDDYVKKIEENLNKRIERFQNKLNEKKLE